MQGPLQRASARVEARFQRVAALVPVLSGTADHLVDLGRDLVDAVVGRAEGDLVGERWALSDDLVLGDLVPDRQEDLLPINGQRDQAVQFVLRPALGEERARQHDQAEAAASDPGVDPSSEAVADAELELVVPDREPKLSQRCSERSHDGVLVLRRMRDEHVELAVVVHGDRRDGGEVLGDVGQVGAVFADGWQRSQSGSRDDSEPRSGRTPQPLHVHDRMPVVRVRDLDPNWRALGQAASVLVAFPSSVALEVGRVQEADVRSSAELDLKNVAALAVPEVGVDELGHELIRSSWRFSGFLGPTASRRQSICEDRWYLLWLYFWLLFRCQLLESSHVPVFPNAPLALVALEVRFPELVDPINVSALRRAVRDILPIPGNTSHDTITFGGAAPVVERQVFPRLMSRDRSSALVVTNEALVLETTTYDGYEEHRKVIERAVTAVADVAQPDGVQRVGMRFIDEIRVPGVEDPPGDWTDWIVDGLLVPLGPELRVGAESFKPRNWQGTAVYDAGSGYAVKMKYGPQVGFAVPPKGPTRRRLAPKQGGLFFLLDSDGAWTPRDEVPEFRPELILEACDTIHEPLSMLFKAVGTEKLVNEVFMSEGGTA